MDGTGSETAVPPDLGIRDNYAYYSPDALRYYYRQNSALCKQGIQCSVCSKLLKFHNVHDILRHAMVHGGDDWASAFRCGMCTYQHHSQRAVMKHLMRSHTTYEYDGSSASPNAPIICDLWDRKEELWNLILKCFPFIASSATAVQEKPSEPMAGSGTSASESMETVDGSRNKDRSVRKGVASGSRIVSTADGGQQLSATSSHEYDGSTSGNDNGDQAGMPRFQEPTVVQNIKPDPDSFTTTSVQGASTAALVSPPIDDFNSPVVTMIEHQLNFVSPRVARFLLEKRIRSAAVEPLGAAEECKQKAEQTAADGAAVGNESSTVGSRLVIEQVIGGAAVTQRFPFKRPFEVNAGPSASSPPATSPDVIFVQEVTKEAKRTKSDSVDGKATSGDAGTSATPESGVTSISAAYSTSVSAAVEAATVSKTCVSLPPITPVPKEPIAITGHSSKKPGSVDEPILVKQIKSEEEKQPQSRNWGNEHQSSAAVPGTNPWNGPAGPLAYSRASGPASLQSRNWGNEHQSSAAVPGTNPWNGPAGALAYSRASGPASLGVSSAPSMPPQSPIQTNAYQAPAHWSQQDSIIWIEFENMPFPETADNIYRALSEYGVILRIQVFQTCGQYQALVQFLHPGSATLVINAWHGKVIYSRYRVFVRLSIRRDLHIYANGIYSRDYTNLSLPTDARRF